MRLDIDFTIHPITVQLQTRPQELLSLKLIEGMKAISYQHISFVLTGHLQKVYGASKSPGRTHRFTDDSNVGGLRVVELGTFGLRSLLLVLFPHISFRIPFH